MLQIEKETVNIWEYKVGNNANIANFMCLWKTWMLYLIPQFVLKCGLNVEFLLFSYGRLCTVHLQICPYIMLDKNPKISSVMDVRGRRVHNTFTFSCGVWGKIFQN